MSGCTYYIINNSKKEQKFGILYNRTISDLILCLKLNKNLLWYCWGVFLENTEFLGPHWSSTEKMSIIYFHVYKANTCYNPVEQQAVISESVIFFSDVFVVLCSSLEPRESLPFTKEFSEPQTHVQRLCWIGGLGVWSCKCFLPGMFLNYHKAFFRLQQI